MKITMKKMKQGWCLGKKRPLYISWTLKTFETWKIRSQIYGCNYQKGSIARRGNCKCKHTVVRMILIYYRNMCVNVEKMSKKVLRFQILYGYIGRLDTESEGFNSNCNRKLFNCSKHVSGIVWLFLQLTNLFLFF